MITYRRPMIDEAAVFATLHVQCWREAYAAIIPAALLSSFSDERRVPLWATALADDARIVIGAYNGDRPVGFIMEEKPLEDLHENMDGQIGAFYIAASHYRLGIGRKLLNLFAKRWTEKGGKMLSLGVLAENIRARSFYEAMGGKLVRTGTYEWSGFKLADAIYVFEDLKTLTP